MQASSEITAERATTGKMSKRRKRRIAPWSIFAVLGLAFALPLASYTAHWLGGTAIAQEAGSTAGTNARSNYWRAVRDGVEGYSAVKGPGANVLVQARGSEWQALRNGPVANIVPWFIVGMAVILLLYHLLHGRNRLKNSSISGRRIKRWGSIDRIVHWGTAITFVILAITGLSMLVGRSLLIPLLGKAGFAWWAAASINIHNVVGPLFSAGIAMMIIMWIWHNFPSRVDLTWFMEGGGLFGNHHPSAGRMNGGEKIWFWLVAIVGVLVCLTGIVLVAPVFGWNLPYVQGLRVEMQQASLIHAVLALSWTAVALGHVYIGTAGTEGAFEGMATGTVSVEWAKQHHDLWYEKMEAEGRITEPGIAPIEAVDVAPHHQTSH